MGVVYYANYFIWFEVGRTDWLREAGWTYRQMEQGGVSLPVIEAHAEYRRAAPFLDEPEHPSTGIYLHEHDLEIRSAATLLTPVRLRFDYEIWRDGEEAPLATGHTVHAAMDPNGRPCRLPQAVRELLASMSK